MITFNTMKKLALLIAMMTGTLHPQSAETPVYVQQFENLQASMEKLYTEAVAAPEEPRYRLDLRRRLFALQKTASGLAQEVGDTDVKSQTSGHSTDRRLRLIDTGCMAIDGQTTNLATYLETNDRAFVGITKDYRDIVSTVRKLL